MGLASDERRVVGPGVLLALALAGAACGPGAPRVLFADEFDGTSLGPAWVAVRRQGDAGVGEMGCYDPSQVAVADGHLVITSVEQATTCGDDQSPPSTFPFRTGMVQWRTLSFTYGTLEFRARMAGGRGTWPAVWMLGTLRVTPP